MSDRPATVHHKYGRFRFQEPGDDSFGVVTLDAVAPPDGFLPDRLAQGQGRCPVCCVVDAHAIDCSRRWLPSDKDVGRT